MHLSEYMELAEIGDEAFARLIGRSRPTVSRIRRRLVRPDWETIQRIETVTDRKVTANDFVGAAPAAERAAS